MSHIVPLRNGGSAILTLGEVVRVAPSFELHLCKRDLLGKKSDEMRRVYRGDNPRAVEATFLGGMSAKERKKDLYATPTVE